MTSKRPSWQPFYGPDHDTQWLADWQACAGADGWRLATDGKYWPAGWLPAEPKAARDD